VYGGTDLMTPSAVEALREQWKKWISEHRSATSATLASSSAGKPLKLRLKEEARSLLKSASRQSASSRWPASSSSQQQQYVRPQDAPGWAERERFASENRDRLLAEVRKRFTLEMNHARMVLDEHRAVAEAKRREEELKAAKVAAELAANAPKRYPSRNNPAAVAIELGYEHGAAEAERREKERRKNAAVLPDIEFKDDYLASVFGRARRDTTDGRPALCSGRQDNAECVAPGQAIPALIVPSPLGCNCSRAVCQLCRKAWNDVERCIFLDKFLQFPKDFKRIASYLSNKTTEDVIAFYYDTKKQCDYKSYLSEHYRRRNKDQSELPAIREQYLAKLGVKIPLCPDLDGLAKFGRVKSEPPLSLPIPCVLVSNLDVLPKQVPVDIFPAPAIVLDVPTQVDASEFQSLLLKGVS